MEWDTPRVRVSPDLCSPTVRFFRPSLSLAPRLRKWQALNIRSNTTHADSPSALPRLIRFAKRVYKLEHALVRGFLRVLLFIRARRTLQYYLHFRVEFG